MRSIRLLAVLAAGLAVAACDASPARPGTDWSLTLNRVWITHLPQTDVEFARTLVFVDKPEARVGASIEASAWRMVIDLFEFKKTLTGTDVRFPQFERTEQWTLHARKCAGEAPPPFELCLVVRDAEKERRFYSVQDWKVDVDDVHDAASLVDVAAAVRRGSNE